MLIGISEALSEGDMCFLNGYLLKDYVLIQFCNIMWMHSLVLDPYSHKHTVYVRLL